MESVSKKIFKAKSLEYLRKVEDTNQSIIITDRGTPVVEIVPYREKKTIAELFSKFRNKKAQGKKFDFGDLEGPVPKEWKF